MNDVTKGFRDQRFLSLSGRDKRDILKLMARVAEQAYRRGAQQGAGLVQRPCFRADLGAWRYRPSLDLSPWVDSPRTTTSLERLDGECGDELRRIGFPLEGTSSPPASWVQPWSSPWGRVLWMGYTREQRCFIRGRTDHNAAPSRSKESVAGRLSRVAGSCR
jgi:hypothetical protein